MISQRSFASLLLVFIAFIVGTILGLLPGLESLGLGGSDWPQYFLVAGVAYAISVIVLIITIRSMLYVHAEIEPSGAIRVVAIDDEADILRLIRIKLTKEGFDVSTASDGEEGVKKVLSEKPDVMVVDVMMPGKDGYQVVAEVKKKLGDKAPVAIMLTSKAEEADMRRGLSVGADDYITKPFSPSELVERINVALIKSGKVSESSVAD